MTDHPVENNQNEEKEALAAVLAVNQSDSIPSLKQIQFDTPKQNDAWLTTFVDLICLMLTFFILLFAVAEPREAKWQNTIQGFGAAFGQGRGAPQSANAPASATLVTQERDVVGHDLDYLESVLTQALQAAGQSHNFVLSKTPHGIEMRLAPSEIFLAQSANLTKIASQALAPFIPVLEQLDNPLSLRILTPQGEVTPQSLYSNDWGLGVARARAAVKQLAALGRKGDTNAVAILSTDPELTASQLTLILARKQ